MNRQLPTIHSLTLEDISLLYGSHKIFFYGAGTAVSSYGRIANAIFLHSKLKFDGFLDDDSQRHNSWFLKKQVYNDLNFINSNDKVLIILTNNYLDNILKNPLLFQSNVTVASMAGFTEDINPEALEGLMSITEANRRLYTHKQKVERFNSTNSGLFIITALDVQVTERCTMKCKDCSNLMQYYQKPKNADTDLLLQSISLFLDSIDYLSDARVIGGEPFLAPNLDRVLNLLKNSEKVKNITVYTNATIIPSESVIAALVSPKVYVEITDYDELSRSIKTLFTNLSSAGVRVFMHKPQNWTDSARIVKNNLSTSDLSDMFSKCCVNDVLTLLHGKIYHCPFSANSVNLGAFEVSENESIDLAIFSSPSELRNKLKRWYFGQPHLDSCRYCLGRDFSQPQVVPAIQTRKPILFTAN